MNPTSSSPNNKIRNPEDSIQRLQLHADIQTIIISRISAKNKPILIHANPSCSRGVGGPVVRGGTVVVVGFNGQCPMSPA